MIHGVAVTEAIVRSASSGVVEKYRHCRKNMNLGRLGHLSYSTLVHPGDNWEMMEQSLRTYVPQVKARVSPNEPFGLSLRLAAPSAELLVKDSKARATSCSASWRRTTSTSTP